MINFRFNLLIFLQLFILTNGLTQSLEIKNGVLDLREHSWDNKLLKLDGDWGFYWMEFVDPLEDANPVN